jgi:hypothetical protein
MARRSGWVIAVLALAAAPAYGDGPTPFDQGRISVGVTVGEQTVYGFNHLGLGAGIGYYVLDGLEVGLSALHEFGDGPSINEVTPSVQYVAQPVAGRWAVIPYIGGFFNHWFLGDANADVNTVGGRAGLLRLSGRMVFGLGIAYEHTLSTCTTDCDFFYPDISAGFTF